ncbi:ParB/RepB/Spo0J family partition protein [Geminicoccaceae bacterium 1502E]|nr:ParB/RepB/Spo0J family partition protein [Geminicoccaceae bacterium 1502E]
MAPERPAAKRRGLGMGLSALLGGDAELVNAPVPAKPGRGLQTVPVEFLRPSPLQPRKVFHEEELETLADSIREKGVLQPLVVRSPGGAPGYEIVAGERRWRAAQLAGVHEVPVLVRELDDREVLELALVENLQREDLDALEEADAYSRLVEEFGHTQEVIAKAIGKSRSHVANMMRLLGLPEEVRELLQRGALTAGHARALIGAPDPLALAREVVARGLNVRETEELVRRAVAPRKIREKKEPDPNVAEVEQHMGRSLGLAVRIRQQRRGGMVTIRYTDTAQLEALVSKLTFSG